VGGRAYPYNDYDIYVISDNRLAESEVEKVANLSAERIGRIGITSFINFKKKEQKFDKNFYIDLTCLTKEDLPKLLPRLKYYKFKETTQVLYGLDVRSLVPDYPLSVIPLSEGAKLLCDRMSQLSYYYSTKGDYCNENLTYFIQQAYAACCTSLLMLSGKYQPTYSHSASILAETYESDFPDLYKKTPKLAIRIKRFINWKLNPCQLPDNEVDKSWFVCTNDIIEVSKYFFKRFLNKKIESVEDLSSGISYMFAKFYVPYLEKKLKSDILAYSSVPLLNLFFKYKYFVRITKLTGKRLYRIFFSLRSPDIIIYSTVPFILNSLKVGNVEDKKEIARCIRLLKKVYSVRYESWEELTLDYANAYFAFFRQKLG